MPHDERKKILVVDADPTWRALVARICTSRGLQVVEASTLEEAKSLMGTAVYAIFADIARENIRELVSNAQNGPQGKIYLTIVSSNVDPSFKEEVDEYALQLVQKNTASIEQAILYELAGLGLFQESV